METCILNARIDVHGVHKFPIRNFFMSTYALIKGLLVQFPSQQIKECPNLKDHLSRTDDTVAFPRNGPCTNNTY